MTDSTGDTDPLECRLKDGDEQALAELFAKHRERLWRMVNFRLDRRLHGRVDPDDVLQEAYLGAAKRIQHYVTADPPLSAFVWIRMMAKQTLIDLHRRHLGAQMRAADREIAIDGYGNAQATSASIALHLLGHKTSPSQAAVRADMVSKVREALETMEPIDQEILALRHFEELTNSEVAEVLSIQQKAASIRYIRAIRRLKDVLAQLPGFFDEGQNG